jgi:hypothetical protein
MLLSTLFHPFIMPLRPQRPFPRPSLPIFCARSLSPPHPTAPTYTHMDEFSLSTNPTPSSQHSPGSPLSSSLVVRSSHVPQ